jgi:hypothetical protein
MTAAIAARRKIRRRIIVPSFEGNLFFTGG